MNKLSLRLRTILYGLRRNNDLTVLFIRWELDRVLGAPQRQTFTVMKLARQRPCLIAAPTALEENP
jgi:hypothetical protein